MPALGAWEETRAALESKQCRARRTLGGEHLRGVMRRKKFRRHHQQRNKNFRFQRPDERKFLAFLSSPRDRLVGDGPNAWKFARPRRSGPECRHLRPFGGRREGNLARRSQVNKEKKFLGNACWKARPKWNSIGNVSDNVRRTEMVFGARWRQSRRPNDSVGPEKHGSTRETIKNRRNFRSQLCNLKCFPWSRFGGLSVHLAQILTAGKIKKSCLVHL